MSDEGDTKALADEVARLRAANAELSRALAQMEEIALRDPLTGLGNRRYFLSALTERIARFARYGEGAAVIFVDVDGLKAINDRHGHGAGDAVLTAIGTHLRTAVRESDAVARIGGDEFGLVIDHVDPDAASAKVAALRLSLAGVAVPHGALSIPAGATFGLTMVGPHDDAAQLLDRADRSMYRAKRSGGPGDDGLHGRPPGA